ncbi:hypothetical protein [Hyunsoonleella aestuarii]|uniref:DUF5017 domain-containing protein n=1 Tax=Hyunsoonleella aestuarii TaxID=912802 RepID=A0ABP8E945_9FLAO|nr:hypothetical protein [Hyunsoonleella aestuarii]
MKRILIFLTVLGVAFTGCNPNEDIYKVIDAQENAIAGEASYTLTSEDYDELELNFGSFSSEDDAKAMLPSFLDGLYPTWGNGSAVTVGYKLYIGNAEGVSDYSGAESYYFSESDYALSGSNVSGFYPDVTASDYIADILESNVMTPVDGQIVLARYVQYTEEPNVSISTNYNLDDNLDYGGSAGDLTSVSGGEWEAHSGAGSGPIGYDIASLSMTDYPSSGIGGSLTVDGSGSEDVTNWFSEISSGKVYASTLVNLSAVSTGTYTFHMRDDDFAVGYVARVGAMDDGSGKVLFGIGASSSSLTYGTTPFDLNTTYLLVSSYDIATGVSNLYVLSTAESTEPMTPEATNSGSPGAIISGISIRQGSGGPTGSFDGIRVATSWSAIMENDVAELVEGNKINVETFYTFDGSEWEATEGVYFVQDSDFDSMGEEFGQPGRFNNFGSSTPAEDYLPTFLSLTAPWAYGQEEDEVIMVYDYFSSSSGAQIRGNRYTFTNGAWEPHLSTIDTSLQFGHDGNSWVPDNTIRYTFTGADVTFISNAFIEIYPGPADNVGFFGSFDRRSGSSNFWSDEMLLEAFNALLESGGFVTDEEQKYVLTFVIYNGSTTNETKSVIKLNGEWVYQE